MNRNLSRWRVYTLALLQSCFSVGKLRPVRFNCWFCFYHFWRVRAVFGLFTVWSTHTQPSKRCLCLCRVTITWNWVVSFSSISMIYAVWHVEQCTYTPVYSFSVRSVMTIVVSIEEKKINHFFHSMCFVSLSLSFDVREFVLCLFANLSVWWETETNFQVLSNSFNVSKKLKRENTFVFTLTLFKVLNLSFHLVRAWLWIFQANELRVVVTFNARKITKTGGLFLKLEKSCRFVLWLVHNLKFYAGQNTMLKSSAKSASLWMYWSIHGWIISILY